MIDQWYRFGRYGKKAHLLARPTNASINWTLCGYGVAMRDEDTRKVDDPAERVKCMTCLRVRETAR